MHGSNVSWAVLSCACLASLAPAVSAQQEPTETLDEIVVTGTRRVDRTVTDSPVPVDVFRGEKLQNMGTGDMDDILRTLIPSYNVRRFPLADEGSLVRPATLRGLPPDYMLILVNGKRRHRSGVIFGPTNGPDVAPIPAIAIERLEVLRDGASAQYGADAVSGVLNFITRTSDEGITAEIETGRFYAGDGTVNKFSGTAGFPLTEAGFINLSIEYGSQEMTARSIQRPDAAALEAVGAPGIPNPAQKWGQPSIDDELKIFINSAIAAGRNGEVYAFGNYSERDVELEFNWRHINRQSGVYTVRGPAGQERMVFDLTTDGSGNCPAAGSPNAIVAPHTQFFTQAEYDADVAALEAVAADPNCWTVNELYPGGYKPLYGANIRDISAVAGYRGEFDNGLLYDVSLAYGENGADYRIRDTLNASYGPNTPSRFDPGQSIQADTNFNIDLVLPIDVNPFASPLSVAAGFEWREESFEIVAGDEASWNAGPFAAQGASIGSHGFPGYSPENAGKWDRSNVAVYLDLEADVTESLTLGLAGRHEDFEDFGTTTNAKLSFRYHFNDVFGLRGSFSTGFRAPTPGLSNITKTSTTRVDDELQQIGLIPPTNPVAVFYGGKPLESVDARNVSAGITLDPLDNLRITLDYFQIDVENEISISSLFFITPEDRATLIELGVPGATDFAAVRFYGNDVNGSTRGFDLIVTYMLDWSNAGITEFDLVINDTQTEVSFAGDSPNRNAIVGEENAARYRGIVSATHLWNDLRFSARASYYDGWVDADFRNGPLYPVCSDERPSPIDTDGCYGDAWIVDIALAYTLRDRYTVTVGADNVFNTFPDNDFLYPDFSRGRVYPTSSPFGYNGGFWYLRLRADF